MSVSEIIPEERSLKKVLKEQVVAPALMTLIHAQPNHSAEISYVATDLLAHVRVLILHPEHDQVEVFVDPRTTETSVRIERLKDALGDIVFNFYLITSARHPYVADARVTLPLSSIAEYIAPHSALLKKG